MDIEMDGLKDELAFYYQHATRCRNRIEEMQAALERAEANIRTLRQEIAELEE